MASFDGEPATNAEVAAALSDDYHDDAHSATGYRFGHGWSVRASEDGGVTLTFANLVDERRIVAVKNLGAEEWATIVAQVSATGAEPKQVRKALRLHLS